MQRFLTMWSESLFPAASGRCHIKRRLVQLCIRSGQ
jgi:hypothetical protein